MKNIIFFMLLSFGCFAQRASKGVVLRTVDGDTHIIQVESYMGKPETITVRIVNVDCPERAFKPKRKPAQAFGDAASDSVRNLIEGKDVELTYYKKDIWGRVLAFIRIDGKRLDDIILSRGWGWAFTGYHSQKPYQKGIDEMNRARKDSLGLWKDPNAVAPWIYRK